MYMYSNVCQVTRSGVVANRLLVRCSSTLEGSGQLPSRRLANYQPNVWNYGSIESLGAGINGYNLIDPSKFDKLKLHVRNLLTREAEPLLKLRAIDAMQRLGIAYHFDEETNAVLNSMSMDTLDKVDCENHVHFVALLFRLRRQNHFPASTDKGINYMYTNKIADELLRSLKDGTGNFKKTLPKNIEGLCSLYEASHLAFEGENFLDEARKMSTQGLIELMPSMHPHLRRSVAHALDTPLHWTAPRLHTRWFIDHYAGDIGADPLMLRFAKIDFNNVQNLYQQELARITGWWTDANLGEKLPFARDRLIECFYFACGVAWEPSFGACREVVSKVFSLVVLLDDIYDIYGTLDELTMFTNAIESWQATACDVLPEYMKAIYLAIFDTSNEVAKLEVEQGRCDMQLLLKKAWHDLCKAFLLEAKWHYNKYNPTLQEYLDNGWVSVSGPLLLLHAFPMLKMDINPNSIQQLESCPKLVRLVSKVFRLCNDSATHSEELKRGDAPSSIAIYMFENGATEHESRVAMRNLTTEVWKMVNQDAFENYHYHFSFAKACVNMARISHCIYQGVDGISAPDDRKRLEIKELFLEPLDVESDE
ncbi:hypothetical protein EJB05_28379, partial [Eragrostis curvula]